jgi:hypothetical protein
MSNYEGCNKKFHKIKNFSVNHENVSIKSSLAITKESAAQKPLQKIFLSF